VRLRRAAGGPPTPELASSLRELANTHYYAGHLAVADSLDRLILGMTRQLNGERHPLVAEDLINLGAVQQEWGHYQEAERYYRQALDITQAFYGPNHYKTAAGLTVLGRALRFEPHGNDEAGRLLQQALAIRERVFGKVHRCLDAQRPGRRRAGPRQVRRSGGARQARARHLSNGVRSQTRVYRRRRRQSGERVPEAQPVLPSRAAVSRGDRHLHRDSRSRAFEHWHCANQTGPDAVAPASLRRGGGRDTRWLRDTREADRSGSELAGRRTEGPGGGVRRARPA